MIGDVKVKVSGEEVTLRLTLGALEQICEVDKIDVAPAVIYAALVGRIWKVDELSAVLKAGLNQTGSKMTAEELVDAVGAQKCVEISIDMLEAFFWGPGGKPEAVAETSPAI